MINEYAFSSIIYALKSYNKGLNAFETGLGMHVNENYMVKIFDDIIEPLIMVIERYLQGEFDCVKVIYNHYVNTLTQNVLIKQVLPVEIKIDDDDDASNSIYDFEGGIDNILDKVLPIYIENIVYGLMLDSKASEHASRMTAMRSATDNASAIISELELMYNRARQAAITLELTDIIGGASATS